MGNLAKDEIAKVICLNCNKGIDSFENHHCVNDLPFIKPRISTFRFTIYSLIVLILSLGVWMWMR